MRRPSLTGARPPALAGLFLIVVGLPAVALVWLGTQLLLQDRSLATQRQTERRQADLQKAARELERRLAAAADHMPPGVARYLVEESGLAVEPPGSVLWVPAAPKVTPAAEAPFVQGERAEFQGDSDRALAAYEPLLESQYPPAIRAGALLRVARVRWRERNWDGALGAYDQLGRIPYIAIEGLPADFVARRARCQVLQEAGRKLELLREAESLRTGLLGNHWSLDRASWELAASQVQDWSGRAVEAPEWRRTLSEVGDWLWKHRTSAPEKLILANGKPVTLCWRRTAALPAVIAIPPDVVEQWLAQLTSQSSNRVAVLAESGWQVAGPKPPAGVGSLRVSPAETGLPWILVAGPNPNAEAAPEVAARKRLLLLGLGVVVLLIAGAGYLLWRVVQRELAVARLQTDFVSAVSHEFRTPPASLRHVTELLTEDDELPKARRRQFYQVLERNTERLHRLVESLLDFARMEAGRKPRETWPVDAAEFTSRIVAEFQKEAEACGFTVDLAVESTNGLPVRADPASLGNALWNLLENAMKYSPGRRLVRVRVGRHPRGVAIAVTDEGMGIPPHEQKEVFGKFIRGAEAKRLGIKGTGLGLAMVAHIVRAHGGLMELESAEGAGSTFRMVLPDGG